MRYRRLILFWAKIPWCAVKKFQTPDSRDQSWPDHSSPGSWARVTKKAFLPSKMKGTKPFLVCLGMGQKFGIVSQTSLFSIDISPMFDPVLWENNSKLSTNFVINRQNYTEWWTKIRNDEQRTYFDDLSIKYTPAVSYEKHPSLCWHRNLKA